ncbi:tRNA pseudouridine38-40 synthase [Faunimonas pinastri]|uniref:tRNA pseudouridine synthase A n=1 Tax=Faunimonas pinastri TaxID=1855383 RepID=A0A1H9HFL9_9HYPH|nr:tRNA pseudouridine(38-40) synthase TruA [Faunimonas pinastri]SEQ61120.1 tRNA pseudouridine38-40 synthase [Faunimonas pinastri]
MPRFKLLVEYDGTPYCGWQRQQNGPSVQAAIERAILKTTRQAVTLHGAGRTDTGVHASGQVAHVDLDRDWRPSELEGALNFYLKPQPVAILSVEAVGPEFDARFSAKGRHYRFRIGNRRAPLAIEQGHAWHFPKPLDEQRMHQAAQLLLGTHDFTTFRAAACQAKSPVRTLDRLDVHRQGEIVVIEASARSFLHNQIRSFAGSLAMVGEGKWSPERLREALDARDRKACGPVAPPEGLTLTRVDY